MARSGFRCTSCNEWHDELPISYGAPVPHYYSAVPKRQRKARCELTEDQCIVDGEHFFVRACLELPIKRRKQPFIWGVWVSQSEANFARLSQDWHAPGREDEPPTFGWLATELPLYPSTLNLKTMLHQRPAGERPYVILEPSDHPLAVEQRDGISRARIIEIAAALLHD